MSMFSLGINTTVTTSAAAAAELRAVSGAPFRLRYVEITLAAATASTYGLGRPAAIGVTPTSPIQMLPMNPNDTAITTNAPSTAVAWATGPTVPAQFIERITLAATIGAGVIWNFGPNELILMPVNAAAGVASVVVWNLATNSANTNITFRGEI